MNSAFYLIDQLILQGVTKFCIAPGSRSAPLAMAAANHKKAEVMVHYDERGLGFYALGYAMAAKKPAALIVTSGSALANLLPAIVEANASHVPLLILSADRPHELRRCGANQTMEQTQIFKAYTRYSVDLSPTLTESYFRTEAASAYFFSLANPPGPVHLNCPFRDPLYSFEKSLSSGKKIPFSLPKLTCSKMRRKEKKGLILLGKIPESPLPVLNLAKKLGWPVFADILSNARVHPTKEQIMHFDALLKKETDLKPDLILHFGERLTSKEVLNWQSPFPSLHISPYPSLQDPMRIGPEKVQADISCFCEQFEAPFAENWLDSWKKEEAAVKNAFKIFFETSSFSEMHLIRDLNEKVFEKSAIFLGNSLSIRYADAFFFPKSPLGFFGNRGVSGIDGNIATLAGIHDALEKPVFAVIGDQTALYDLNSFSLLKNRNITLLILNNFGGRIFSHLPAKNSPHFEKIFAMGHNLNFQKIAEMFGVSYTCYKNKITGSLQKGIIEGLFDEHFLPSPKREEDALSFSSRVLGKPL